MAFTPQEKEIILYGKSQGKSREEIEGAIGKLRSGVVPKAPEQEGSVLSRALSDIPSDIVETGKSAGGEILEAGRRINETLLSEKPVADKITESGAGVFRGLGRTLGELFLGVGKAGLTPEAERSVAKTVGSVAQKVINSDAGQQVAEIYKNLSPEKRAQVDNVLGYTEGLTSLVGFGKVLPKLTGKIDDATRSALEASDEALRKAKNSIPAIPKVDIPSSKGLLDEIRYKISDVDPQARTEIEKSTFDEVNRYFQKANAHKIDASKDTPMEIVGEEYGVKAYDAIDEARKLAIKGKKSILEKSQNERVSGNTINEVMSSGIQRMNERFGASIDAKGNITQGKGRTLQLDASDQKLVSSYFSRLNSLGVAPSLKQVDDFVDWAQGQLYKQGKTLSKFEVASEPVVRELQSITGNLNSRLKDSVGNGYGEVNARISHLIDLQDEISRGLGADARKGAGLMKRLFSPSGGETRRIFKEIKDETGIDLVKEATLAKFAMESVGDVKQNSLLKQIDLAKDVAEFDITKPLSALKFLIEKGDLDGQALANEIIRRAKKVSAGAKNQ